jgi:hypothetical protein
MPPAANLLPRDLVMMCKLRHRHATHTYRRNNPILPLIPPPPLKTWNIAMHVPYALTEQSGTRSQPGDCH